MPTSDHYYMVPSDKLKRLNEERSGWVGQGLALSLGVAIPCLINAQTAKDEGAAAAEAFYWNSIGVAGGAVACVLLSLIALSRLSRFRSTMKEIESGKQFKITEKGLTEIAGKPIESSPTRLSALLSHLKRLSTESRTQP